MRTPKYDFVIVGAGSAGCVLAARLSEDPERRVLLLEAGGSDRSMEIRMPAAFTKLFKTKYDWDYTTAPQEELSGRELYWPRAKVLGGCSSMNAQMYVRGNAADYNLWEDLGNPGWSFAGVLPYFMRAEGYTRPFPGLNGDGGPLRIEEQRDPNPTTPAFLRAAEECGIPRLDDVNGPSQDGAAYTRVTQRRGRRWSSADAYLRPAMPRKNLTILTGVQATRILFAGRRATGIDYLRAGKSESVSCGELILSSGSVSSPQLLMISGIGPAPELRAFGVKVVHDSPGVGRNLQDHLAVAVISACPEPVTLVAAESIANLVRYFVLKKGLLTSNVGEACAFVKSRADLTAPDLELLFAPVPYINHGLEPQRDHALTIGVILLQPKSRGSVKLRSPDPLARPKILPQYLSDERGEDLRAMTIGIELARRIFRSPALSRFSGEEIQPGAESIEECIRKRSETLYHPVGTCRMGTDDLAVVDPELRVRGVEGLRVVDASVMPTIIRGHTHAPTVMIAEKAADLILGRAGAPALGRSSPVKESTPRPLVEVARGRAPYQSV
jgi:choline dehydrogenase